MSEPTAGEVLELLAEWVGHHDRQMQAGDDRDIRAFNAAESDASRVKYKLLALKAAHLRTLAAALTAPAPAEEKVPTYSYVEEGCCYICGQWRSLFRWDDYDDSSELVCRTCAEAALKSEATP